MFIRLMHSRISMMPMLISVLLYGLAGRTFYLIAQRHASEGLDRWLAGNTKRGCNALAAMKFTKKLCLNPFLKLGAQ
jgi:hypothetical protein